MFVLSPQRRPSFPVALLVVLLVSSLVAPATLAQPPTVSPVARIAPASAPSDFAFRLAADGDLLAVATPSTEQTHVFRRAGGFVWSLESVIGPLASSTFDGRAVAVTQGRIAVPSRRGNDIFLPDGTLDTWVVSTGGWQIAFDQDNFLGWQSGSVAVRPVRFREDGGTDYTAFLDYDISSVLDVEFHLERLVLISISRGGQTEAHVATRDPVSGDFVPSAQLVPSVAGATPISIAVWGDTVVVGSVDYDAPGQSNQGAAFVFEYDAMSDQWIETGIVTASDGAADHWFGRKVDLRGDLLLVSATRTPSAGQGYLFRRATAGASFTEDAILVDPLANGNSGFGNAIALGDTVAYVNAGSDDTVLAYALDASPASTLTLDPVPACVATNSYTFTGQVTGGNAIAAIEGDRYGVAPETACADCGVDPAVSWTSSLAECDNRVIVTATDALDRTSSTIVDVRYDVEPAILSQNRCVDRTFTVDPGETVSLIMPGARDVCDQNPERLMSCDNPGPYGAGVTTVACTDTDQCGNVASCSFTVTVNETQPPAAPEVTIDAPACTSEPQATVTGSVVAADPIARLAASVAA
ncbi:MAG: HYR domain-containing protein, partial [Acidobacteriota bacterium]